MQRRGGFSGRGGRPGSSFGGRRPDQGSRSFGNDNSPPETVFLMGSFMHACEGEMVCKSLNEKIPYFNAPIYLENKVQIGKVDEILGPLNEVYFTIKTNEGIVASSFKVDDKFFIAGDKLLPLERFLPKPKAPKGPKAPRSATPGGPSGRGGRGSFRGGRGSFRGHSGGISKPSMGRGGGSFGRGGGRGGGSRGGFGNRGRM